MTIFEFNEWVNDPSKLDKSSLLDIKQMIEDYPYFPVARMLYLKNLAVIEDVRLQGELQKMSVFIPDRKRLFDLIENKKGNSNATYKETEGKSHKISEEKVQSNERSEQNTGVSDVVEEDPDTKASGNQKYMIANTDYANWLEANAQDIPVSENDAGRLKHQDLIDSFIENESEKRINIQKNQNLSQTEKDENEETEVKMSEKSSLDDSYFTETLARVYISQKRYDKALEIIRTLSLKYPEKNVYFADQIRYLEKIININK
jgi:hypothetical protein